MSFFRRPATYLIGVPLLIVLGAVGGPFVYIHFIEGDPPAKLSFGDETTTSGPGTTVPAPASFDGEWKVAAGSVAGYRVKETLVGQSNTAVGRTSAVTGSFTLSGTTVNAAKFVADLTKVSSDKSQRDGQFQHRIMNTSQFPTATFDLSSPIDLGSLPDDLKEITVSASGQLTLHGATKTVTFDVIARRNGGTIEVNGTIPITFSDYGINNPSGGPASVGNSGDLEFLLKLTQA
jgi:polyisoprenoid-binding protein YceI